MANDEANEGETMTATISIFRDDVWAGDGHLSADGVISGCSAVLGSDQDASDETYDRIEGAVESRHAEIARPDGVYTWTIEESQRPKRGS